MATAADPGGLACSWGVSGTPFRGEDERDKWGEKGDRKEDIPQVEQLAFIHILLRFAFAFDFDALYFGQYLVGT
jgi:hypothetical protein